MGSPMTAEASLAPSSQRMRRASRRSWRRLTDVWSMMRPDRSVCRLAEPITIRRQLLFTVNTVLGVLLGALLMADYVRGIESGIDNRREALLAEAVAIHRVVGHLGAEHGVPSVQSYLDSVCSGHRAGRRTWHHIIVEHGAEIVQAEAHGQAPPGVLTAVRRAASANDYRGDFESRDIVVGTVQNRGTAVYVAESTDDIRRAVRGRVLTELATLAMLSLVAALVVNGVILAIVARPLERLTSTVRHIGSGRFGLRVEARECFEMHALAKAVTSMSVALAENDAERRSQMENARRLQQHLLPDEIAVPGLAIACWFRPADAVAGDYYDLLALPGGGWLIAVADVTGHGVAAAMGAAMLKTLLAEASAQSDTRPGAILKFVNSRFAAVSPPGNFASVFLARWSPESDRLEYASAGHEPGLWVSASGEERELRATGTLLGIDDEAVWETASVPVLPGTRLLVCTDGVTEASDASGDLFGRGRLKRLLRSERRTPIRELVNRLESEFDSEHSGFRVRDDVTVVAVEFGDGESSPTDDLNRSRRKGD